MNLLRYIILLSFSLVISHTGKSQILTGPLVGGQATTVRYSPLYDGVDFSQAPSFHYLLGWSYSYAINEALGVHSELVFSQKGKAQNYHTTSTRAVEHKTNYSFLEAPLLLRVTRPFYRGRANWFLNAGPQVSYWLGGRGAMEAHPYFGSTDTEQYNYRVTFGSEVSDGELSVQDANRIQFALAFGGGVGVPVNRSGHQIMVNLRYIRGTTQLTGNESFVVGSTDIEEYLGYRHSALQLSVSYVLPVDVMGLRRGKTTRKVKHRR